MSSSDEELKCSACGEPIGTDGKQRTVSVDIGVHRPRAGWTPKEHWGTMHESCFRIAIGDPDSIDFLEVG